MPSVTSQWAGFPSCVHLKFRDSRTDLPHFLLVHWCNGEFLHNMRPFRHDKTLILLLHLILQSCTPDYIILRVQWNWSRPSISISTLEFCHPLCWYIFIYSILFSFYLLTYQTWLKVLQIEFTCRPGTGNTVKWGEYCMTWDLFKTESRILAVQRWHLSMHL